MIMRIKMIINKHNKMIININGNKMEINLNTKGFQSVTAILTTKNAPQLGEVNLMGK